MTARPFCPSCGGRSSGRGRIPAPVSFGGRALDAPLPGRQLYRCRDCRLLFAHPNPPDDQLLDLYRSGGSAHWAGADPHRDDWSAAARRVERMIDTLPHPLDVLDVGCAEGTFLSTLPDGIRRHGVEVHAGATAAAQARGIDVVATSIESMPRTLMFDVVTAFDVIEHVPNPHAAMAQLASAVRPGGVLIVGTGNADAPSWRLMASRYWYCYYPEHLAFVSPHWCAHAASDLGLTVAHVQRLTRIPFPDGDAGAFSKFRELVKNLAYRVLPLTVSQWFKERARGGVHAGGPLAATPPLWAGARDHFVIEFRK